MRKNYLRILIAALTMTLLLCGLVLTSEAASASIWFDDPTVTVGSNVSIGITVKGEDIGGYETNLSYDPAFLTFVSATGPSQNFSYVHSNGVLRIIDYVSSGSVANMRCTVTFTAKKTGTTKITPTGSIFSSGGGDAIAPYSVGDSTVKIIPVPEASSDSSLKSLAISGGTLTPAFAPNVTEYSASVDFALTEIAVTALKNHGGATVVVEGTDGLKVGENLVTVTVTAENGAKTVYNIKVIRGKNPLSTDVFLTIKEGVSGEIAKTISEDKIPAGFDKVSISLGGVEVEALKYDENSMPAVYLLANELVIEGLYFVEEANMVAKPFVYLDQDQKTLTLLDVTTAFVPEGYEVGTFTFGGVLRRAMIPANTETPNHCLVYALNDTGLKTLYLYDPIEQTYQRFDFAELGEAPATTVPEADKTDPPETEAENKTEDKKEDGEKGIFSNPLFKWLLIGIALVVIWLIGVAVGISIKRN